MKDWKRFLDAEGRVKAFPAKRSMKAPVLAYLAEKFEADRTYTEREVNELLDSWHTFSDAATLRRELYDAHYLVRDSHGTQYRRETPEVTA